MIKVVPVDALESAIAHAVVLIGTRRSTDKGQPGEIIRRLRPEQREALARLTSDMVTSVRADTIAYCIDAPPHWSRYLKSGELARLDARLIDRRRHFETEP